MSKNFKFICFFTLFLSLFSIGFSDLVVNQNGDFSVGIPEQKSQVFNDNIDTTFVLTVTNNLEIEQTINLDLEEVSGWDVLIDSKDLKLKPLETKEIPLRFKSNSYFDYVNGVVSSDTILIGKQTDYRGYFEFPIKLSSGLDKVSVTFQVEILSKEDVLPVFEPKISTTSVSPLQALTYTIESKDLFDSKNVDITVSLGDKTQSLTDSFSEIDNYKVYEFPVASELQPGVYNSKINVRLEDSKTASEWFVTKDVTVLPYLNIQDVEDESTTFYKKDVELTLNNLGNVKDVYTIDLDVSYFSSFFFSMNEDYSYNEGKVNVEIPLERGEVKVVNYGFNYIPLYLFFAIVLFILGYIFQRKVSNPLDVEVKVYGIKRSEHEGIKSLKVKLGFENVKEKEIETLKMNFRLPSYLHVDEHSFLLAPPKHVLKGRGQFKLQWEFKRFENGDSRILGFTMINNKGILGDIHFDDLEFEMKINGKVRKYRVSLPMIKG